MRIDGQHVKIDGHAHAAGKGHFAHGCQQTAVGAVMVGQYMTLRSQLADDLEEGTQRDRVVDIRNSLASLIEGLRQNGSAKTLLTKPQTKKNNAGVARSKHGGVGKRVTIRSGLGWSRIIKKKKRK